MSDFLLLGPLLLQDFELPARISWGGAQRLAVHRLPGGQRVLDAMGRDDAPITWQGVFTGADAALRARLLDLMRANGSIWPLIWDTFLYSVVVSKFEADFMRVNWIPYKLELTVLRDEAEGLVEDVLSAGAAVLGDMLAADGLAPALGLGGAGTDAAGLSRLGAAGPLLESGLAAAGAGLLGASLASPAAVLAARDQAGQLAGLAAARGYVQRAEGNAARAGSEAL
jgi:hypothetical protein